MPYPEGSVIAISRRQFLAISATLSVSCPFIGVTASSNSGAGAYPITIAILKDAYSEEKRAAQRYVVFSGKAVEEQYPNIAYLFAAMAASEAIHARNYKRILGTLSVTLDEPEFSIPVSDTKANLIAAAEGELKKIDSTYPDFLAKLKPESHKQAIAACMYSWKSHKQHQAQIKEIKTYSRLFFGPVAKEIEEANFNFHVCQNCGSTMDEAPSSSCVICLQPPPTYRKIKRPA
jgi:rubrerythrin